MYFRTPLGTPRAEGGLGSWCAAVACAVFALVIGIYPRPLIRASVAAKPATEYTVEETDPETLLSVDSKPWAETASPPPHSPDF